MTIATGAPALRLVRGDTTGAHTPARRGVPSDGGTRSSARSSVARTRPFAEVVLRDVARLRFLVVCLCAFGLVMVLGSSSVTSIVQYGSPWGLFERQAMWTVLGAAVFFVASRVRFERLRTLVGPALVATTAMLVAVLVPGLGRTAGGSSRWIGAGPVTVQPSELMKLVFALFLADIVARREKSGDHARELLRPIGIVLGFEAILILKQPDMGTAVVLVCMTLGALYAGGASRRLLAVVVAVVTAVAGGVALAAPYRRARLLSFVNPFGHVTSTGYQVVQSLVALGSGHLGGTGVGSSAAIWGWLPNAQTDFVFAVVGNELGLVGGLLVVVAFALLGWLGLRVAAHAPDRFSSLLVTVLTCWIVCQAMINIGGVVGVLPETGIPLPFVSSGGSSLVVLLGATGLIVNVGRRAAATRQRR